MEKEVADAAVAALDIKSSLTKLLISAVSELGIKLDLSKLKIELSHPTNPKYGDLASNIAFKLAGMEIEGEEKTPQQWAKELATAVKGKLDPSGLGRLIQKVEAVGGFVNFYLSDEFFSQQVNDVLAGKEEYGRPVGANPAYAKAAAGRRGSPVKKIVIEFGQPNTHKLPHVGHLRSYVLGESLARLLEFAGHEVFRANYQGDVGLHVAKCLWAFGQFKIQNSKFKNLQERISLLQKAYTTGSKAYEEDSQAREEIDNLNTQIYQKDPEIFEFWQKTRNWSLEYYDEVGRRLGVSYDRLYFESEAAEAGKKIVLENLGSVFKESQGAIIFAGSKYDLHDRVFITMAGNPTYEAKDLALIFLKQKDFDYDLSLISTASEQTEYFKVVYQAASLIDKELAEKFVHIPFGLVSLTGAKLSSREGNIVTITEVLEKVEGELRRIMRAKDYTGEQIKEIVDVLTVGAVKYSLLKNAPRKDIVFDVKESVNLQGNSGPYLQYTYARARSILRRSGSDRGVSPIQADRTARREKQVLRLLYQFPEIVEQATREYAPNLVCNFLFELAQEFNSFYETEWVIGSEREEFRLGLVKVVGQVIKNGLGLLGIEVLERM